MRSKSLVESIVKEFYKSDRHLKHVEFNIRRDSIIMNFEYDDLIDMNNDEVHTLRHDKDPEWVTEKEYEYIVEALEEEGLPYEIRRDEFI